MEQKVVDPNALWNFVSKRDRYTVVGLLFLVSVSSYMDRFVLSIVQEQIREEFALSDTQLGLMSGFAFAFLYSTLGIPIARWADRGNRRTIITLCLSVWSLMTAICGMAQNYVQLLLARVGVGIGEAGTIPPSHSFIGDFFPPDGRSTPLAILTFGNSTGIALGMIGGGYIAAEYGWRTTFMAVGLPGLALAIIVRLLMHEPRLAIPKKPDVEPPLQMVATIKALLKKSSYLHLVTATSIYYFVVGGAIIFLPSHLIRALHIPVQDVGLYFGVTTTAGAGLGALVGGQLADRMTKKDIKWIVLFPAIALVAVYPLFLGFLITDNFSVALLYYFIAWTILTMGYPPIFAAVQGVAGSEKRAIAVAFLFLVGTLLGNGLGPVFTGIISDAIAPSVGDDSLRYSLMIVFVFLFWSAWHFWHTRRFIKEDFEDQL